MAKSWVSLATVAALVAGFTLSASVEVKGQRFCDLWTGKEHHFDLVAVTDDENWGQGRDEDMALINAFRKRGRKATRVSIQDFDFDWTSTKMAVIRSAWDKYNYFDDYMEFLNDTDEIAILVNPRKIIQWQARKDKYLPQLAAAGVRMPETVYVQPNDFDTHVPPIQQIEAIKKQLGCEQFLVMKPALGNAGEGVRVFPEDPDIEPVFRSIIEENDVAIFQCYQENVAEKGERGIVFLGGEISHGLLKMPDTGEFLTGEDFGAEWSVYEPTPDEVRFAKDVASKVQDIVGETLAYLRVDVFDDNEGNLALMELAAGTANMWLSERPEAAELLAKYLDEHLREKEQECKKVVEKAIHDNVWEPASTLPE